MRWESVGAGNQGAGGEKNKHERMMKEMERMIEGEEEESEQADPVCEGKREVMGGSCEPAFPP